MATQVTRYEQLHPEDHEWQLLDSVEANLKASYEMRSPSSLS